MLSILFGAVFGAAIGWKHRHGDEYGRGLIVVLALVGAVAGLFFTLLAPRLPFIDNMTEPVVVSRFELISISNDYNLNGRYFLGSGRTEETDYIHYRYLAPNGKSKLNTVEFDDRYMSIDARYADVKAEVVTYAKQMKDPFLRLVFIPYGRETIDFVVPSGTLVNVMEIK